MVVLMERSAERDSEFVTDLEAHRPRLSEPWMMEVDGAFTAHQAGMRRHEFELGVVALLALLTESEFACLLGS
jgi:hypothetical protein